MKIDISNLIGDLVEATVRSLKEDPDYEKFLDKETVTRKYASGREQQVTLRTALNYAQGNKQMDGDESNSYSAALGKIDKEANKKRGEFNTDDLPDDVKDDISKFQKQAKRKQDAENRRSGKDTDAAPDEKGVDKETLAAVGDEGGDDEDSREPKSDSEREEIRKKAYPKDGQTISYGSDENTGEPTDKNFPSDGVAKQTSWETGHNNGKPPALEKSKTTGRDIEAAPGDAGSLLNELGSNEVADLLQKISPDGDDLSDEDLAKILDDQFGKTHAAVQNGSQEKNKKPYMKRLIVAAQAGRRKHDRIKKALENAEGFNAENSQTETLYGAGDSLEAARQHMRSVNPPAQFFGQEGPITEVPSDERTKDEFREAISLSQLAAARKATGSSTTREDLEKLDLPFPADIIELSKGDSGKIVGINKDKMEEYINNLFPEDEESRKDPEKIKAFMEAVVLSAGGGNNPADTTTIVKDDKGNLIVLQHSDKADLKAQLANSTPNKEFIRAKQELERMERDGDISADIAAKAEKINEEAQSAIKEEEAGLSNVKKKGFGEMAEFVKDKEQAAMILKLVDESEDNDSTLKKKFDEMINSKKRDGSYNFNGETREERLQSFMNYLADENSKVSSKQNRIIEKIRAQMVKKPDVVTKDGEPWGAYQLDSSQQQAEIRKNVVKHIQERIAKLNELKDSQGRGVGDVLETKKIIDLLHLYQMDEPSRGVYINGITETIAGAEGVTKENLKKCLGVDNTEELIDRVRVGPPPAPEGGEYIADEKLGVPEAYLTRDVKNPEVDDEGKTLYWIYDENGKRTGKTSDKKQAAASGKKKGTAVPVGTVTAQKAVVYYEDRDGNRYEIATMATRAKGGPQSPLGTGYAWSKDMQDCLAGKNKD